MNIKWTTEKPTKLGFYLTVRRMIHGAEFVVLNEIRKLNDDVDWSIRILDGGRVVKWCHFDDIKPFNNNESEDIEWNTVGLPVKTGFYIVTKESKENGDLSVDLEYYLTSESKSVSSFGIGWKNTTIKSNYDIVAWKFIDDIKL